MTYSEIQLTFDNPFVIDESISFDVSNGVSTTTLTETYKASRTRANEVGVDLTPISGLTQQEADAIAFIAAFTLDYNATGLYEITRDGNVVTIKSTIASLTFANASSPKASFVITNFAGSEFSITSIEFEASQVDVCKNVRLKVTTSVLATTISAPEFIENNTENPFYIDLVRSGGILQKLIPIKCISADGQSLKDALSVPNTLGLDNLSIEINPSPNGGTVIAYVTNSNGLNLEYSLNDTDWFTNSVFDSLATGSYTMYVRDQFGCKISKTFTISEFTSGEEHFYISPSLSIPFVNTKIAGIATAAQFSENDDVETPYKSYPVFKNTDVITVQFESSYQTNTAKVVNEVGTETPLVVNKKTNNQGLKDSRDATRYSFQTGKTGIYFTTGKTYDYDTGLDNQEDYTLNGYLPEWAVIGGFIKIENAWFTIEDIVFDEERLAEVVVIDVAYTGVEGSVIVSSIYDREIYEVFEAEISMSAFNGQEIQVIIENQDPNFKDLEHTSETLAITSNIVNFKEIVYSNDNNTDILYATGIQNKMWLRTEKVSLIPIGESENYVTDNTVLLIDGSVRQSKEFVFEDITTQAMIRLYMALFHRQLFIDGQKYVLSEVPEVEGGLEDTNLYTITAKLILANDSFVSKTGKVVTPNTSAKPLDLPSLIEVTDGSYIKI